MNYETVTTLSTDNALRVLSWCKAFTSHNDLEYILLAFNELDIRYKPYSEEWTQAKLYIQQAMENISYEQ